MAAGAAEEGIGFWGESNWSDRAGRDRSILLLDALEPDLETFRELVVELRPNLVLIGAMSLCLPGAVAMARMVKRELGENTFVVLGGKHVNETLFEVGGSLRQHPGSPLLHMLSGRIPPKVFDLVISGDGEEIIYHLGELVGIVLDSRQPLTQVKEKLWDLREARGNWLAAWLDGDQVQSLPGSGVSIPYDQLRSPPELFGIRSNFPVFGSDLTAHAISDIGRGCVYDCFFCSERSRINSINFPIAAAPLRLAKHFEAISETVAERYGGLSPSVFVEDSIFLGGTPQNLLTWGRILEQRQIQLPYGGQLTADLLLDKRRQKTIVELYKSGLRYIFWGLETGNEGIASSMSKNVGKSSWLGRNERVLEFLTGVGIRSGLSIVFGLGESQRDRLFLLRQIGEWQARFGAPDVVSFNWAVQHPLRGDDDGAGYLYLDWGTPADSPYLDPFWELFGEASERYGLPGQTMASENELAELCECAREHSIHGDSVSAERALSENR